MNNTAFLSQVFFLITSSVANACTIDSFQHDCYRKKKWEYFLYFTFCDDGLLVFDLFLMMLVFLQVYVPGVMACSAHVETGDTVAVSVAVEQPGVSGGWGIGMTRGTVLQGTQAGRGCISISILNIIWQTYSLLDLKY